MNYSEFYNTLLAYGMGVLAFVLILAIGVLVLVILYLLTLQNTLAAVSPQNRKMAPGLVWLTLAFSIVSALLPSPFSIIVSLGGVAFTFFVIKSIAESLDAEYRMRGIAAEPKPTFNIGMAYLGVSLLGTVITLLGLGLGLLSVVIAIASLVCWIIYWVQVAQNKNRLRSLPSIQSGSSQIFGA